MAADPRLERSGGFATRAIVNLLTAAAVGILAVANEVLAARLLGTESYGLFALAVIFTRAAQIVAQSGLDVAVYRQIPIDLAGGNGPRARPTVFTAVASSAAIGTALALLLALSAGTIAESGFGKPELATYLRVVAIAVPGLAIVEITASALRAAGGIWSPAAPLVGARACFAAGVALLMVLAMGGPWVAVAFAVATFLPLVAGILLSARLLPASDAVLLSRSDTWQMLVGASPMLASALVYQMILWTDVVVIGWFRPASEVGIYRACLPFVMLIELVLLCWNVAAARLYPVYAEQRDRSAIAAHYERSNRIVLFATAPYVAVLIAMPELPLRLMGPDFAAGATVIAILAVGYFIRSGLGSAAFALVFTGHPKAELKAALSAAAASVVLNVALVPVAGILGAAIASATANTIYAGARIMLLRRHWAIVTTWRAPAVAGLAVLLGAVSGRMMGDFVGAASDPLFVSIVTVATSATCSVLVVSLLGLQRDDRAAVRRAVARFRGRNAR